MTLKSGQTASAAAMVNAAAPTTDPAAAGAKPRLEAYVLHTPKLLDLRKTMCAALEQRLAERFDSSVRYVEEHGPDDVTPEQLHDLFLLKLPEQLPDPVYQGLLQNLHVRQASNLLKHHAALKAVAAAEDGDDAHRLVLEDDVVFNADVAERLGQALHLAAGRADSGFVMLGLPVLVDASKEQGAAGAGDTRLEDATATFRVLPCCDSYLVRPSAARKLLESFLPCRFPGNVQLSYALACAGIKPHTVIPNVFVDGTKVGVYISSLNANNRLFLNDDYNALLDILKRDACSEDDLQKAVDIFEATRFRGHPDMAYLIALLEAKAGRYQRAIDIMGQLFNVYRQNGALLGAESEFLRTYISLHRHVDAGAEGADADAQPAA